MPEHKDGEVTAEMLLPNHGKFEFALENSMDSVAITLYAISHAGRAVGRKSEAHGLVDKMYEKASIRFNFSELESLSPWELLKFKIGIEFGIKSAFQKAGFTLTEDHLRILSPNDSANLIEHEMDHIRFIKMALRKTAVIDVIFKAPGFGQPHASFGGISWLPAENMTNKELALAFSEPSVLSEADVIEARGYASVTKNKKIVRLVESRIGKREIFFTI